MNIPIRNAEGYPDPTAKAALDKVMQANRMTVEEWAMMKAPKRPKYRNKKTVTPDGEYDSQKEAARHAELQILERAGRVSDLERQVPFEIIPAQRDKNGRLIEQAAHYIADFMYLENGQRVIEDVKSPPTRKNPAYVLKRKLMLERHDVRIREV